MSSQVSSPTDIEALFGHSDWIRALARDLLRDSDRAEDVVQDTWLAAIQKLKGGERDEPRLRAWLAEVARNFARSSLRGESRRRRREESCARPEAQRSTTETLERIALQEEVTAAVLALAPPDREIVSLRYYEGLPPRAIAERLGLTAAAVSTRLARAKATLRRRLDSADEHGTSSWAAVAAAWTQRPDFVNPDIPSALAPTALLGGLSMKAILVTGTIMTLAVLAVYTLRAGPSAPSPRVEATAEDGAQVATVPRDERGIAAVPDTTAPEQEDARRSVARAMPDSESAPDPGVATGTLIARVRVAGGDEPAAGVGLVLTPRDVQNAWFHTRRDTTDLTGTVRFEGLAPGMVSIDVQREGSDGVRRSQEAEVIADATTELDLTVAEGVIIRGLVTDAAKRPVAGAAIWLSDGLGLPRLGHVVTHSAADGSFEIRHATPIQGVAARAAGYAPSNAFMPIFLREAEDQNEFFLELELPDAGGDLAGEVVDSAGRPAADALVLVGNADPENILQIRGKPAYDAPLQRLRTDGAGRFQAQGLPAERVRVRARGLGTSTSEAFADIPRAGVGQIRIVLGEGATIVGSVSHANGRPVVGAHASLAEGRDALERTRVPVAEDGSFELTGVPVGRLTVVVEIASEELSVEGEVITLPGQDVPWQGIFPSVGEVNGQIVDPTGNALVGWDVRRQSTQTDWVTDEMATDRTQSGPDGSFRFESCPLTAQTIEVRPPGQWFSDPVAIQENVVPGGEDARFRIAADDIPAASLRGRVLDENGEAVSGVRVTIEADNSSFVWLKLAPRDDGSFEVRSLPSGDYKLTFTAEGFESQTAEPATLEEGEARDVGLVELVGAPN